jgi:hypothetical protein
MLGLRYNRRLLFEPLAGAVERIQRREHIRRRLDRCRIGLGGTHGLRERIKTAIAASHTVAADFALPDRRVPCPVLATALGVLGRQLRQGHRDLHAPLAWRRNALRPPVGGNIRSQPRIALGIAEREILKVTKPRHREYHRPHNRHLPVGCVPPQMSRRIIKANRHDVLSQQPSSPMVA